MKIWNKIKNTKLNIILALDSENGLWKNWDLAWKIREDMIHFSEITTWNKKNAVIMGRKTWNSIPEKYKPLPNRINCILSTKFIWENTSWKIRKFSSLENAITNLKQDDNIEQIFIIWWSELYNNVLKSEYLDKIYLTRVKWDFYCDVFVNLNTDNFKLIENSDWKTSKNGIDFKFEIFNRII